MKLSALLTSSLLGLAQAQTKIKFMPLGDSITEITCWRPIVWDTLVSLGLSSRTDFVGTSSTNQQNCRAQSGSWDMNHQGHSGYQAVDIANRHLQGWVNANRPDIVNFMLGTNDVAQGRTTQQIEQAYTNIVRILRSANPRVKIIVDLVIPLSFNDAGIQAINRFIPAWAAAQNRTESPIVIADCRTGYTNAMNRDGVHPNAQGDRLIAERITPLLVNYLRQAINETDSAAGF